MPFGVILSFSDLHITTHNSVELVRCILSRTPHPRDFRITINKSALHHCNNLVV